MKNIEKYISDLNWHNPESIQENAVKELSEIDENEAVLLAQQSELYNKFCWHNASIVLKNIGYPRNRLAIPYLMEWFKDVNWPGIQTIIQLLKEIDVKILLPHIKNAIQQAIKERDDLWAYGLVYLVSELGIPKSDLEERNLYDNLVNLADRE